MKVEAWIEKWHNHGTFGTHGLAAAEIRQVVEQVRIETLEEAAQAIENQGCCIEFGSPADIVRELMKRGSVSE